MALSFSTIVAFLIGLLGITLMVIVHELGHFAAARIFKIKVESLSFGFGPVIKAWDTPTTRIILKSIPFGGSCKMAGNNDVKQSIQNNEERLVSYEEGSIFSVSPVKRIFTYLAGPAANFIFAILLYTVLLTMPVLETYYTNEISVTSDYPEYYGETLCPASLAGMKTGDRIISINGTDVKDFDEIRAILEKEYDSPYVVIKTEGETFEVSPSSSGFGLLPHVKAYRSIPGKKFGSALASSFKQSFSEVKNFLSAIRSLLKRQRKTSETINGTFAASTGIGTITEKGFKAGFRAGIRIVLITLSSVSISMAVANLFPITALDGGLILIAIAELFVKDKLKTKTYIILQFVGIIVVFVALPVIRFFD